MFHLLLTKFFTVAMIASQTFAQNSPEFSNLNLANLSRCEREILMDASSEKTAQIFNAAVAVTYGTAAGMSAYGVGHLSTSTKSSSEIVEAAALNFHKTPSGVDPFKQVLISAVSSGVTVGAILYGVGYGAYKNQVAKKESLVQFFKDVKNNGMGPQIEVRTAAIHDVLSKPAFIDRLTKGSSASSKYNKETYEERNILEALVVVGRHFLAGIDVNCSSSTLVSSQIDELAIKFLIERYNPELSVTIK